MIRLEKKQFLKASSITGKYISSYEYLIQKKCSPITPLGKTQKPGVLEEF